MAALSLAVLLDLLLQAAQNEPWALGDSNTTCAVLQSCSYAKGRACQCNFPECQKYARLTLPARQSLATVPPAPGSGQCAALESCARLFTACLFSSDLLVSSSRRRYHDCCADVQQCVDLQPTHSTSSGCVSFCLADC